MKGLRALIERRRDGENRLNQTATTSVKLTASTSTDEHHLQLLNQHYAESRRKRLRNAQDDLDALIHSKRQAVDRLAAATKILQQNCQPLKLYGETADDIINRAEAFTVSYRAQVFESIPQIPLSLHPNELLLSFVKTCFAIWGERIISNHEDARVYDSSQKAMTPFVKCLKFDHVSHEIRDKLYDSAVHCIRGEYKDAHAAYISLAIGDAPWPMGVTMVGIHERVGRSRIAASEITHVLDDEPTCRYIQVFKRLLSLCQSWYPVDDMSQMVLLSSSSVTA